MGPHIRDLKLYDWTIRLVKDYPSMLSCVFLNLSICRLKNYFSFVMFQKNIFTFGRKNCRKKWNLTSMRLYGIIKPGKFALLILQRDSEKYHKKRLFGVKFECLPYMKSECFDIQIVYFVAIGSPLFIRNMHSSHFAVRNARVKSPWWWIYNASWKTRAAKNLNCGIKCRNRGTYACITHYLYTPFRLWLKHISSSSSPSSLDPSFWLNEPYRNIK